MKGSRQSTKCSYTTDDVRIWWRCLVRANEAYELGVDPHPVRFWSPESAEPMNPNVSNTRASLFHFRSKDGTEVDAVLEAADGRLVGVEVKSLWRIGCRLVVD